VLETRVVEVAYPSTSWVSLPALGLNLVSPGYLALTTCVFAGSNDVVRVAIPAFREAVPRVAESLLKVMISPLGGSPALELTVAVKVTGRPANEGFCEEPILVTVGLETLVFSKIPTDPLTVLSPRFTSTRSGMLSPFTSAATRKLAC